MLLQFIELGIYRRNDDDDSIVYDVIVDGVVVKTCNRKGTALIELAAQIDAKIGG